MPNGVVYRPAREFDDAITDLAPIIALGGVFLALPNAVAEGIAKLMRSQIGHGWTDEEAQAFLLSYARPVGEDTDAAFLQGFPIQDAMPTEDLQALLALGGQAVWSRISQDMIVPGFDATMSAVGPTSHRAGATIVQPAFSSVITSGPATSIVLTDSDGSPAKNVTSTPTSFFSNGTFVKNTPNQSVVFTGTFMKGLISKIRTVTHTWLADVFWGVSAMPGVIDTAFLNTLNNALQSTNARTFSGIASAGQHFWWASPVSYGTPTFQMPPGGLPGGYYLAATISYLNQAGLTLPYQVWATVQTGLGNRTTQVS